MSETNCDQVRDQLPDRLHGRLDDVAAARLEKHLAACEDCRSEAVLLERLRASVPVPAGLESRIQRAVRVDGAPRILRFPARRHLALAATVVFALVTATLVTRRGTETGPVELAFTDAPDGAGLVWSSWDEPLLPGDAGLHALSVEELELVLQELER